ncbi:hypothetical protein FRC02_005760 [Tulasnella sp. 418]|nr:hypothetical protein FRC02_005760 [Tulasnella sp. 418]
MIDKIVALNKENDTEPHDIPEGWYAYIHPEGATYHYHPILRVITPCDISNRDNWRSILNAFDVLMASITEKARELPVSCEIYFELSSGKTRKECLYYLIDHTARIPFWITDIATGALGLEPVASSEHMKSVMIPEYWQHIEHFPMHNLYPLQAEEELIAILGHGLVDDKTAPTSTTPYSAMEVKQFLYALEIMKNNMSSTRHDGYRLCTVARLWLMIARTRHVNAYGLRAPRLDRLQSTGVLEGGEEISPVLEVLSSTLLLDTPRTTFKRLRNLWHGRIVYQRHWQAFFEDLRRDWIHSGVLTLGVWIADVGLLYVVPARSTSRDLTAVSCGLSVTGVLLSSILYKIHTEDKLSGAFAITEYLIRVESYDYGLQPLSVMLSLPYTFFLWAILTSATALVVALLEHMGRFSLTSFLVAIISGGLPLLFLLNATSFFAGHSGPVGVLVRGTNWVGRCIANAMLQLLRRPTNQATFD